MFPRALSTSQISSARGAASQECALTILLIAAVVFPSVQYLGLSAALAFERIDQVSGFSAIERSFHSDDSGSLAENSGGGTISSTGGEKPNDDTSSDEVVEQD